MSIDTIGDFLTVIRNGLSVGKRSVTLQHSNLKEEVAKVLKDEGYIKDYKIADNDSKPELTIALKYVNGESVIHKLTRISRPGRRHYEKLNGVTHVIGGLGVSVLTTSKGVMSDRQAKQVGIGGEVICHVW
jgi:small subunit ribosomal protein S8